jgi:uncharacterized protein (DUF169 family)
MMTLYESLLELTGERWTGVRLYGEPTLCAQNPKYFARLCEAIGQSFESALTVNPRDFDCRGALRTFGLNTDDEDMAQQMACRAAMPIGQARQIIRATPSVKEKVHAIEMGCIEKPDIVISYLTPGAAMRLLRRWQQSTGRRLETHLSAFTAVCAAVAGAFNTGQLVFSFGCPDSRDYGGIAANQLIAAMPVNLAEELMQEEAEHAHIPI